MSASGRGVDIDKAEPSQIPQEGEHAEKKSGITNPVHDECLVSGRARRCAMEVKPDQQVRAQSHALPPDKHQYVVVPQNQREHGEHEQIEISEEAVIPALVG